MDRFIEDVFGIKVGTFGNIDVKVFGGEGYNVPPHFHFMDATDHSRHGAISLESCSYVTHRASGDTKLTDDEVTQLDDWLHSSSNLVTDVTNYEYACIMWDNNNFLHKVACATIPNYKELS